MSDAYEAHDLALQYGGRAGVLDAGRIEAAISRPYSGYFRLIAAKAGALFEAVAINHGFVDGNKRTAVLLGGCGVLVGLSLTDLLIKRSGYRLIAADPEEDLNRAVEALAVSVARGDLRLAEVTHWFNQRLARA